MSTFFSLAFAKSHVLAELDRDCLRRFLEPYRAYLERRRVQWDDLFGEQSAEAFPRLITVLMEP